MKTTTIGLLLPSSSIRSMSKDFERALKKAANECLEGTDYELEVIPEMIGAGSVKQVDEALDKFFGYHDVELVTGITTRHGMANSMEKFSKRKIPFIFNCLGEHLLPTQGFGEYVLVNSYHFWQQSWLLGYYAGKNIGSKGLSFCSMYDSGYSFLSAFQQGLLAANPDADYEFKLLPMPDDGALSPVKEAFDVLDFTQKDFVSVLLCGEEAKMFLEEFKARGLQDKVTLLGLPFLIGNGELNLDGLSIVSTHHKANDQVADLLYKDVFKEMGKSTGIAIAKSLIIGNGEIAPENLNKALIEIDNNRTYDSRVLPKLLGPISILKHTYGSDGILSSEVLLEESVDLDEDEAINELRDAVSANWMNPYMAI